MSMVRGVISLAIAIVVTTSVLLTTIHNTNTSEWSASEVSLWTVTGIIVVTGLIYGIASVFGIA